MKQLSHDRDECLQRLFSSGDEFVIECFDILLTATGDQGRHIQGGSQVFIAMRLGRLTDLPDCFVLVGILWRYPALVDISEGSTQALIVWVVDSNSVID